MDLGSLSSNGSIEAYARARASVEDVLRTQREGDDERTARAFEALFATLLVRELRRTLPDGLFGAGPGADSYEGWFDEHVGNVLAEGDTLGLAGIVRTSLARKRAAEEHAATEAVTTEGSR
jgi:Rod binding domain-containing protein